MREGQAGAPSSPYPDLERTPLLSQKSPETPPYITAVYRAPSKVDGRRAVLVVTTVLVAPLLLGAGLDALSGHVAGWGMTIGAVTGATGSALLASRRSVLSWVAPLPALVVAVVTVAAGMVTNADASGSPATRLIQWAVAAFPAMAAAECAVLVVAVIARCSGRAGRHSRA